MGVQLSFQVSDFFSFRYIPRSRVAGSYGSSIWIFWRAFLVVSIVAASIYVANSVQIFPFLHILTYTCYFLWSESESEVAQSCPTLCNPMDCSLPGSSVHGIHQARMLEWVSTPFSRGFFQPRDRTWGLGILNIHAYIHTHGKTYTHNHSKYINLLTGIRKEWVTEMSWGTDLISWWYDHHLLLPLNVKL